MKAKGERVKKKKGNSNYKTIKLSGDITWVISLRVKISYDLKKNKKKNKKKKKKRN